MCFRDAFYVTTGHIKHCRSGYLLRAVPTEAPAGSPPDTADSTAGGNAEDIAHVEAALEAAFGLGYTLSGLFFVIFLVLLDTNTAAAIFGTPFTGSGGAHDARARQAQESAELYARLGHRQLQADVGVPGDMGFPLWSSAEQGGGLETVSNMQSSVQVPPPISFSRASCQCNVWARKQRMGAGVVEMAVEVILACR